MKNKEVFIAKNGRPYVKNENGRVKFISDTDWEQYKTKEKKTSSMWLLLIVCVGISIYIGTNLGGWI